MIVGNVADINNAVSQLMTELVALLRFSIIERGVNRKVMQNTLVDSRLYNEIETAEQNGVISILANYYIEYIESGVRRGVWVPISALTEWASRKGIPTDNNTIYAIQYAIWRDGIPSRPVVSTYLEHAEELIDEFVNNIGDIIVSAINLSWEKNMTPNNYTQRIPY